MRFWALVFCIASSIVAKWGGDGWGMGFRGRGFAVAILGFCVGSVVASSVKA